MQKLAKKLTSLAAAISLTLAGVLAPATAGASPIPVTLTQDSEYPQMTSFTYRGENSMALPVSIFSTPTVWVGGEQVSLKDFALSPQTTDTTTESEYKTVHNDVTVTDLQRADVSEETSTHTVQLKNTGTQQIWVQTQVSTQFFYGREIHVEIKDVSQNGATFHAGDMSTEVTLETNGTQAKAGAGDFDNQSAILDADSSQFNVVPGTDSYRLSKATWTKVLEPGETLEAAVRLTFTTPAVALDSDGDGLPDDWETWGVPLSDGTTLPINQWGADPHRKDIFLQLNWMKSDPETRGCVNRRGGGNSAKLKNYSTCNTAQPRSFAPDPEMLNDLVTLFDEHDISLHIDAGPIVIGMPKEFGGYGGPTIDYREVYFGAHSNTVPGLYKQLETHVTGARASVFRLGTIVDYLWDGKVRTSGVALLGKPSFTVANFKGMTKEEVRNTILHEMGHTLGLQHSGRQILTHEQDSANYMLNHVSVMDYLYQMQYFNYLEHPVTEAGPASPLFTTCPRGEMCYAGTYSLDREWDNLFLGGGNIGHATDQMVIPALPALPEQPEAKEPEHEADVHTLEVVSAQNRNGLGAINIDTSELVKARNDNFIQVTVRNKGADLHRFRVLVQYGNTVLSEPVYTVNGVDDKRANANESVKKFAVDSASLTGDSLAVTASLINEKGQPVATAHSTLPVLDLDKSQLSDAANKVVSDSSASAAEKESAKRLLRKEVPVDTAVHPVEEPSRPTPSEETSPTPTTTLPKHPAPTTRVAGTPERTREPVVKTFTPEPTPAPTPDSQLTTEAIIGIVFGVIGIGTLAAAIAAFLNGMF